MPSFITRKSYSYANKIGYRTFQKEKNKPLASVLILISYSIYLLIFIIISIKNKKINDLVH